MSRRTGYLCGVDIGGTFTDCVAIDADGTLTLAKTSSTPPEFAVGFENVLTAMAEKLGLERGSFLSQIDLLLHGTTVGTNVLVQMNGAKTGLITTRGHGDALLIMRSVGRSAGLPLDELLHVSRHRKPDPIVPRPRIKEVSERVDFAGDVLLPLNEQETYEAAEALKAEGVEAVAISFLWGFVEPAHERRAREIVEEVLPDAYVGCAHELIAKPGEYERTAGTTINAYLGPSTAGYLRSVARGLARDGYSNDLLVMQASGGVASVETAIEKPLFTIGSGPVGGVAGAAFLGRIKGHDQIIAGDMGGTSFDVGLIADGAPLTASDTVVNQYRFFMPRLDIESIGSGGGSIVWFDPDSGTMRVGPQSAGADPGPAAYGRGGTAPTITDCNLILGRFEPDVLVSSGLRMDREAAFAAIDGVAQVVGMTPVEAAAGAVRIIESQMAGLMRQMTVGRGIDPRSFAFYSFGGAGGAHAVSLARELGAPRVVVPLGDFASAWSALGVMTADVVHVKEKAVLFAAPFDPGQLESSLAELEESAREQLTAEGFVPEAIDLARSVEMKFSLQIHELEVPLSRGPVTAADVADLPERFVSEYERNFGRGTGYRAAGIQIGMLRIVARGTFSSPELSPIAPGEPPPSEEREVYWEEAGDFVATPVYSVPGFARGVTVAGPAVIQLPETTIALPPRALARTDEYGSIEIDAWWDESPGEQAPAGAAEGSLA